MVDMTVGGTRFWKTYDVVSMTRRVVADWNARHGTSVPVRWVNDPTELMRDSYPADPPNWTRSLGPPKADSRVPLAGRPFTIKKQFLDDIETSSVTDRLKRMKKALLVMHSPTDQTVGIENAAAIFTAAKHPKSFISLDGADHLVTREADAAFAAS
ncbi:MAG: alpha/beta hydrolase [Synechococcaceae cyanobacterium RL_1_2]|nr:alpha/beta hydrolase [Synechococcaceae cyanobacterium RL_1_2]